MSGEIKNIISNFDDFKNVIENLEKEDIAPILYNDKEYCLIHKELIEEILNK